MREKVSVPDWGASAVVALAAGVAGVAGSYGAAGFTPAFVVAPVEATLSRSMPGQVITFAITVLGNLGQKLNLVFATLLVAASFAVVVGLAIAIGQRVDVPAVPTAGTAAAVWALAAALTVTPVPALGAAAGASVVVAAWELSGSFDGVGLATEDGNGRRRVVSALGVAAAAGAVGTAVGRSQSGGSTGTGGATTGTGGAGGDGELAFDVGDQIDTAEQRSFDIEGMDPSISEGFYQVDISSVNPNVDTDEWTLSVTGAVEEEVEFTYEDLREMDHEHRFMTLRCVGESLNGHKMDTAVWTGVPIASVLEEVSVTSGCECVMLRADGDGFFEEFPMEALESGMFAYGMNGRPLPRGHGAPVRALIPGHWGEINVKWLTEMEFLEREKDGYWEKRGWHGTGPVKTVAKLHGVQAVDDGQDAVVRSIVVGGHAYAGTRGISEVEVSIDGGETWETAELTERLPGATGPAADVGGGNTEYAEAAWRLWRYEYDVRGTAPDSESMGKHDVVVRAYERDGTRQPSDETGPFPSGPSGWVSQTIDPSSL